MDKKGDSHKFFTVMILFMAIALIVTSLWNHVPIIKESVDSALTPTLGALIRWNPHLGIAAISLLLSIITLIVQKYATDQQTLKELKKEQKEIQKDMEKYKEHPEKRMELSKEMFEMMPKMMAIQMRSTIFTIIPFILLIRWFMDFFALAEFEGVKFLGFMSWFWYYLVTTILFSSVLRKVLKVE
jgi:uncharacterized membrane protein (DUF106 family)